MEKGKKIIIYIVCMLVGTLLFGILGTLLGGIVATFFAKYLEEKNSADEHEKANIEGKLLEIIERADLGDENAKELLSAEFDKGLTAEKHNELRWQIYEPKANNGDMVAQYWMGFLNSMIKKDAKKALFWYESSAKQGDVKAMKALAQGYNEFSNSDDYGDYGPVAFGYDAEKEEYWLTVAAEAGDGEAQNSLALNHKINGENDKAVYWYEKASKSENCGIRIKAYYALADFCEDTEKKKQYLIKVLTMKQENVDDLSAYDETTYASAAFSLGATYYREFNSGDTSALKNAIYCLSLAYFCGHGEYAMKMIKDLPYNISDDEWYEWQKDARTLSFRL